jgi:hypothetical protein
MKAAYWLKVITILNFVAAACLILLATARVTHILSPQTIASIDWVVSLPLRPLTWVIFRYSDERLPAEIALGCLAGLAIAGGFGLRRRLNWARRCTILLCLLCMAYMAPAVLLIALSTGAMWVVPLGLAVFIGGLAAIVWYLLQPEIKEAMGGSMQSFSRARFAGMIALASIGSLLFFAWLIRMGLQAVGTGVR